MTGHERPDTQESLRKMRESLDQSKPSVFRRLLSFQMFASTLLVVLVIITGTAFGFALSTEREAREVAEDRRELFEGYIIDVLTSVEDTQRRGVSDRDEIRHLLEHISEILDEHVEDGRIE